MMRWAALATALLAVSCAGPRATETFFALPGGEANRTHPVPAVPPQSTLEGAAAGAAPVSPASPLDLEPFSDWQGGEVEQLGLTRAHPVPATGYGLYIYELPGDLVSHDMLVTLEDFNCGPFRRVRSSTPGQATKALMLLPVTSLHIQPEPVDLALSHDFLRVTIGAENARLIYIVITASPIANPEGAPRTAAPPIVISIPGKIAPFYVTTWLSDLRQDIETGDIASPSAFWLECRSLLYQIGSVGNDVQHYWIQPAEASEPPSCS